MREDFGLYRGCNRERAAGVCYARTLRVNVLFFGILKDVAGRADDELQLFEGARLGDVFDHYAERSPKLRELERSIVLARNQRFAPRTEVLSDGDEIAFLPPVSGGAPGYSRVLEPSGHFFALTRDPVDAREVSARVRRNQDGAIVVFDGVVRDNTKGRPTLFLEYECYEPMAIKVMADIGCELSGAYPIGRIAMVHRLGRLEIGESSVVIAVSAPHRRPAFEAALEAIDRLKRRVPIWKKEHFAGGEVWVEGQWDDTVAGR